MVKTKKGYDKKKEFLRASIDLFLEKGYEKTTIKDIINKVGVSKGAFYHYFESKEDIIEKISDEYTSRALQIMKDIIKRNDLNAIEKINKTFVSVQNFKKNIQEERYKLKSMFHSDGNMKLYKKLFDKVKKESVELFKEIVDDGISQGLIKTNSPKELAEFIFLNINNLNRSTEELVYNLYKTEKKIDHNELVYLLEEKLDFYEEAFNRVLNSESATIKLKEAYIKNLLG